MYGVLLISCLFGFLCAFPINPWDIRLIPQEQQPLIYIIDRPYFDATFLQRSAEIVQPLTANLVCASVPMRVMSQGIKGPVQALAQGIASQAQGAGQALQGQFQDVIQSSQSQLADVIGGAQQISPVNPPSFGKPKEENRDIAMIKPPINLSDAYPRSKSSIEAEEESTKDIVPEPNDKAIPVGGNENADDEEDDV